MRLNLQCSVGRARRVSLFLVALLLGGTACSAPTYVAKVSSANPPSHASVQGLEKFSTLVKSRTNGEVDIRVFANSQLGGEAETLEGMRLGSIQGGMITSSLFSQWVPEAGALDLPFLFRDDEQVQKACKSVIQSELGPKFLVKSFRSLGCFNFGARNLISTFPVNKLEDIKGKKIRVIQSPIHVKMWQLAGANPTPIPAPETYSAMQSGVVDMMDNPKTTYFAAKWYEVGKYYIPTGHVNAIQFLVFSEPWFAKLPKNYQDIMTVAATEVLPEIFQNLQAAESESLKKTVALGSKVISLPDLPKWKAAMLPLHAEFSSAVPAARSLIEGIAGVN